MFSTRRLLQRSQGEKWFERKMSREKGTQINNKKNDKDL